MSRTFKDIPSRFRKDIPMDEWHDPRCPNNGGEWGWRAREYHREVKVVGTEYVRVNRLRMIDANGHRFGATVCIDSPYGVFPYSRRNINNLSPFEGETAHRIVVEESAYKEDRLIPHRVTVVYNGDAHPGAVPEYVHYTYKQTDDDGNETLRHRQTARYYEKYMNLPIYEEVTWYTKSDETIECEIESKAPNAKCKKWPDYYRRYSPNRVERRTMYHKLDRANTRAHLDNAKAEYNAWGETDDEPENYQHRHTPWLGGWWD